ncbi:MAG: hypothetical protein RI897_771 [Verrucomicrobiota bacterium]
MGAGGVLWGAAVLSGHAWRWEDEWPAGVKGRGGTTGYELV